MEKKTVSGILFTLLVAEILTLALNVQPVKSDPGTIWVPDDYPTIQGAVNAAGNGDIIRVKAGVYLEDIVVQSKSISIIGESAGNTIIRNNRYDSG